MKEFKNPKLIQWKDGTFGLRGGRKFFGIGTYYFLGITTDRPRFYEEKEGFDYALKYCRGTLTEVRQAFRRYQKEAEKCSLKIKVIGKLAEEK